MKIRFRNLPSIYYFLKANKKISKVLFLVLAALLFALIAIFYLAFVVISALAGLLLGTMKDSATLLADSSNSVSKIKSLVSSGLDWVNGLINKYSSIFELITNF